MWSPARPIMARTCGRPRRAAPTSHLFFHTFPEDMAVHGAAWPQPNCFAWRFLGVLRDLAVHLRISINRQDAKNAKKSAKQNSFQKTRDLRFSSTEIDCLLSEISVYSVDVRKNRTVVGHFEIVA